MPVTEVRLWDSNNTLRYTVAATDVVAKGDGRAVTLPLDHPAARWLIDEVPDSGCPSITIDDSNGRWAAPLNYFEVAKVGACPQCEHCQAHVVKSVWRMPPRIGVR